MAGYSKMDIMSMSEEDIKKALQEEGKDLPEHTIFFMMEELKRREQFEEAVMTVDEEPEEEDEGYDENYAGDQFVEGMIADAEDVVEEIEEEPELTEEELQAQKEEENRKLLEEYKKSRKHTLYFALIGAGVAAVAAVVFILYLYGSGALS